MSEQRMSAVESKDTCRTDLFIRTRSLVLFVVLCIIARSDVKRHILVERDSMKCSIVLHASEREEI